VSIDLAAVEKRHQLTVDIDDDTGLWCGYTHVDAEEGAVVRGAESQTEVICALLKARYEIVAVQRDDGDWDAEAKSGPVRQCYITELAAVVALADRLAGHTPTGAPDA
jgi:hypothetical protein